MSSSHFSALVILFMVFHTGCSREYYSEQADEAVYGIIGQTQEHIVSQKETTGRQSEGFSIDTEFSGRDPDSVTVSEVAAGRQVEGELEVTIRQSLNLAVSTSREYQTRRESLFSTALSLTREEYEFGPRFFAGSDATFTRTPAEETIGEIQSQGGVNQNLIWGTQIAADVFNSLLRFYVGTPRPSAFTRLSARIFQPLLRGFGPDIAGEQLLQAKRDVVYELRSYERFAKSFALDTVSDYWRLLQNRDRVRNAWNSYQNLIANRKRAQALSVDRLPAFQVDQALQNELQSKTSYISTVDSYRRSLDNFKLRLGIPPQVKINLIDNELKALEKMGLADPGLLEQEAFATALTRRLDLQNDIGEFEDARRQVYVVADRLRPDLNVFADFELRSEGVTDYTEFNLNRYRGVLGIELNLPIDRLRERNEFRAAEIRFQRAVRNLQEAFDNVRVDIREGLRDIRQARRSYGIQRNALELALRRVDSSNLLLQAGRAQIRDILDAEADLLSAQDEVTARLIDYHIARLRLFLNIGVLSVESEEFWLDDQGYVASGEQETEDIAILSPSQLFGDPEPQDPRLPAKLDDAAAGTKSTEAKPSSDRNQEEKKE